MTKDKILAALPGLSKVDLIAIKTLTGALLDLMAPGEALQPNNPSAWLYEAVAGVLGLAGTYSHFSATTPGKQFNKKAPEALGFITGAFAEAMGHKVKALAVMRYLLGLLVDDLKRQQVPVTINTVTNNLGRLPTVFRNAFPGYHESGIASLVMLSIIGKEK